MNLCAVQEFVDLFAKQEGLPTSWAKLPRKLNNSASVELYVSGKKPIYYREIPGNTGFDVFSHQVKFQLDSSVGIVALTAPPFAAANPDAYAYSGLFLLPTTVHEDQIFTCESPEDGTYDIQVASTVNGTHIFRTSTRYTIQDGAVKKSPLPPALWLNSVQQAKDFWRNPNNRDIWHLISDSREPKYSGSSILIDGDARFYYDDGEKWILYPLVENLRGDTTLPEAVLQEINMKSILEEFGL